MKANAESARIRAGVGCGMIFGVPLSTIGTLADHGWRAASLLSWAFFGDLLFLVIFLSACGVVWELLVVRLRRSMLRRADSQGARHDTDAPSGSRGPRGT